MTNLQALQSVIGINYPFDPNMYEKALIDQGLTSSDTYSPQNGKGIDLAVAAAILTIVTSPDIKEGGYQVTLADRNALLKLRSSLLLKYGVTAGAGTPVIRNASNLW